MQTEQAELHFRQGSSDKVYHLQLENVEDQWSVQAQWGRRGSALQSDVKASGGLENRPIGISREDRGPYSFAVS
jgi:hypothetical protein